MIRIFDMDSFNKEGYIIHFFSQWIHYHCDEWEMFLQEIEGEGKIMFYDITDWKKIYSQITDMLRWLIEIDQFDFELIPSKFQTFDIFIDEIIYKKRNLLAHLPEFDANEKSANVDYLSYHVYSVYNNFFEVVRQIVILNNFSDQDIIDQISAFEDVSKKIKEFRNDINLGQINSAIRNTNSKLQQEQKCEISLLKDFAFQLQGWLEDRLFAFETSVIPGPYLSIEDLYKDIDFQYNYLEGKSKCLTKSYPKAAKELVELVNAKWEQFQTFYTKIISYKTISNSTIRDELFPIRTNFLLGNIPEMIQSLRSAFASVPSSIYKKGGMQESHFHIAMHSMFKVLQLCPLSELSSSTGRLDMCVPKYETVYFENKKDNNGERDKREEKVLYILEFKISDSDIDKTDEAFDQIKKKDYGLAHKDDYYRIYGLGLCFSTKDKNIVDKYKQAILLYENGKRQYKLDK